MHSLNLFLVVLLLAGCSTVDGYNPQIKATPTPNETPTPPPPPPPPTRFWGCKISNSEGRIFKGIGDSAYQAQNDAKIPCERQYRHCVLLKCESGVLKTYRNH